MATKMSRKGKIDANSPAKEGNIWPGKETHLGLSPKALPTILSDTSPQEEVGEEVRRRSRRSEQEEVEGDGRRKSRRAGGGGAGARGASSGTREEMLLQEGEGLTVRSLYRYILQFCF